MEQGRAVSGVRPCRVALAALARATAQQGHELQLAFPSRQQETLYAPLLAATGLKSGGIHPAVVGAGCQPQPPAPGAGHQVLLHWGDLKAGKGREAALALLQTVLELGQPWLSPGGNDGGASTKANSFAAGNWAAPLHNGAAIAWPEPERTAAIR